MGRFEGRGSAFRTWRHLVALALLAMAAEATAADQWLRLQAPRFGVISQLDEDATRRWAVEFDQFISALELLYAMDAARLPPLTIVLFRNERGFAPYRDNISVSTGKVEGFFATRGAWSVIGLAGSRKSIETRRLIQHEAVHWFLRAANVEPPPWFEEGLAEVFSTFEVKDGTGRWGAPLENSRAYLLYTGIRPVEEFLRIPDRYVLHADAYYPQAWALLHYMLFGNGGVNRSRMTEFLRLRGKTDLDTAFETAFDKSYDDVTRDLEKYLKNGRFSLVELTLPDRGIEMQVAPASAGNIEASLALLALGGRNNKLARQHIDRVIELAPTAPTGHELLATLALGSEPETAITHLDKAIELQSRDANMYLARATAMLPRKNEAIDNIANPSDARRAANLLLRAVALRPLDAETHDRLVVALANVASVTDEDAAALAIGRRVLPTSGYVLVGEAIIAHRRGDLETAKRLLQQAQAEPLTLNRWQRIDAKHLSGKWGHDSVYEQVRALTEAERFADAMTLLDQKLADATLAKPTRLMLEAMRRDIAGILGVDDLMQRQIPDLVREARFADALALLDEQLAGDALTGQVRRNIESARNDLAGMQRVHDVMQSDREHAEVEAELRAMVDDTTLGIRVRNAARRALRTMQGN